MSDTLIANTHDLKTLVLSYHPVIVVETVEEERLRKQMTAVGAELDLPVYVWSVTQGLAQWPGTRGADKSEEPLVLLKQLEQMATNGLFLLRDLSKHLEDHIVARKLREVVQHFSRRHSTIVLCGESVTVPQEIEHVTTYYELPLPDTEELRSVLKSVLGSLRHHHEIEVNIRESELDELLGALSGMTLSQARQIIAYCVLDDGVLSVDDIRGVLERKSQVIRDGGVLEYYPPEKNLFQLGGFGKLKAWLERARVGFSDEAKALNLQPPRGILLVGVQGCGKSLAAKVIARQWNRPILKLDAGRLFDKYIGETERNFRKAIALAESMAPDILWIDEIEKGMPASGSSDSDGGLGKRLFGSFLTWLQEKKSDVFVVATANDLSALPPELLRKGRFDEIFFVDLPARTERKTILSIHLMLRKQDPGLIDVEAIATATDGFSGAELEQVVISALYRALHLKRSLDTELILEEVRATVPLSVSRKEDVEALRRFAGERFVSVR